MNRGIRPVIIFLVFAILGIGLYVLRQEPLPGEPVVLGHECYVWQRLWNEDLRDSIQLADEDVQGFTVLAAEIDVRPGREKKQIMSVDYSFLSSLAVPVGIAIRINPYSGPFDRTAPASQTILGVIEDVLEKARSEAFYPVEIQIDYDCAESKLAGYGQWIRTIQQAFPDYPVVITALPSWMKHRQFKKLVQSCDGYILQVHSLERPETIEDEVVLCDPHRAVKWVRQADRIGVPFRVALPTYGYHVAYDTQGQFKGLSAEGAMPAWKENARIKTVLSDPKKIAAMIQEIQTISPKNLSGLIWFRLPVQSDQLNWQWHTLQRVIRNQPLCEQVEVLLEWPQSGLAEIYLINSGDVDNTDALTVWLEYDGDCLAADGVSGYSVREVDNGHLQISGEHQVPFHRLHAQQKLKIAWCRFGTETEIKASVQSDAYQD